jgi:putative transcriptional regulator
LKKEPILSLQDSGIRCHLGQLLERRGMTLSQLSDVVGITLANLSVLKTNKAKAVRFSSLEAICRALECDVGDLLTLNQSSTEL